MGANFIQFLKIDFQSESNQFQEKWQRKFFLMQSDSSSDSGVIGQQASLDSNSLRSSINLFSSYWKNMKTTDSKSQQIPQQQKFPLNECFQIEFHSYVKNLIYLANAREIFIFDLVINQTIGYIQLDKIHSPFLQIYSCSQADVLYSLHDNGSVTVHSRFDSNFQYSLVAQTDQIRLPKNSQVFGFSVCPNTQKNFSVLLSDGRVLNYELFQKRSETLPMTLYFCSSYLTIQIN